MYRQVRNGWKKHLDFIVLDLICLEISFVLASLIRNSFDVRVLMEPLNRNMLLVLALSELVVIFFREPFKDVLHRNSYAELFGVIKQAVAVILVLALYLLLTKAAARFSRLVYGLTACFYALFAFIARLVRKRMLEHHRQTKTGRSSLLIITTGSGAEAITKTVIENNFERYMIAGIVIMDESRCGSRICDIPVVADVDTVLSYLRRACVDEIILNLPEESDTSRILVKDILEMGIVLHRKITDTTDMLGKRQVVEHLGDAVFLTTSMNIIAEHSILLKRFADIIVGVLGCIAAGLLILIFGPAIYAKSPGPVIFTQTRIGKNGRKFKLYKIRSMYMDAEARKAALMGQNVIGDGKMFKMENDPRIIGSEKGPGRGIGNFIRKYSIDEFPQFLNVLKGDMSLIGTRPPTEDEWEKYDFHHRSRMAIKPGITGMWQVSGRSNVTDFESVVKLDQEYINEWSMALDLKILVKTFTAVFGKNGAM